MLPVLLSAPSYLPPEIVEIGPVLTTVLVHHEALSHLHYTRTVSTDRNLDTEMFGIVLKTRPTEGG